MEKKVNFCGNCPFCESMSHSCNLADFLKQGNSFIETEGLDTPDWCPLKKEQYTFKFKKFSTERTININSILAEIEELEAYFSEREYYHTETIKDSEFIENDNKLKELYTKLNELHENEELSFYQEDFQNDILQKVNEIKSQLGELEDAGVKLQAAFSNLGKLDNIG